jgi:hypothetical protein
LCIRAGNHVTPGWDHAVRQLLAPFGVDPAGAHPHVHGGDELARHIRDRNAPILTLAGQPAVAGAVLKSLVEPVALFPWCMMWRAGTVHSGLHALFRAAEELAERHDWRDVPGGAWLPAL